MFEGFPVPDFDFDDMSGGTTIYDNIPDPSQTLLPEDRMVLANVMGVQLQEPPLRCTNNSSVYMALSADGSDAWAVKITQHKRRVHEEFEKRQWLGHSPFLVETIGLHESTSKAMLQMELCENGDISQFDFTEEVEILQLIHDIGNALNILHTGGWMHLDVSPGNILVSTDMFKLADFGTVIRLGEFQEGCEGAGPYVSPEALAFPGGEFDVGAPTDIFSFGVVLLEAVTGTLAPRGGSDGYVKLRRGELKVGHRNYVSKFSQRITDLINAMLDPDPSKRPTAAQLVALVQ